jgi:hypothetical protein
MASSESKSHSGGDSGGYALGGGVTSGGGITSEAITVKAPSRVDQAKAVVKRMVAVKSVDQLVAQGESSEMHRTLGAFDLTLLGVGEIVGKWVERRRCVA